MPVDPAAYRSVTPAVLRRLPSAGTVPASASVAAAVADRTQVTERALS
jgi:hypothetical protein